MANLDELQDEATQARVGKAIVNAVTTSFAIEELAMSNPTAHEIKRRSNTSIALFRIMRNDLHWSITKICDQLPRALAAELLDISHDFLTASDGRGWVQRERRTDAGLILPT